VTAGLQTIGIGISIGVGMLRISTARLYYRSISQSLQDMTTGIL